MSIPGKLWALLPNIVQMRAYPYAEFARKFFRGRLTAVECAHARMISYSQLGEDIALFHLLNGRKNGFYVDVGAYHPYALSNTYFFYSRGWRGLNIEPNPEGCSELDRCRKRDINLNIAVSSVSGEVDFTCDGVFSGIDDITHLYKGRNANAIHIRVKTLPLRQVFDQWLPPNQPIDFMSVDCEGHDLTVLKSNDWSRFRPEYVLVEDHGKAATESPDHILREVGYSMCFCIGWSKFFKRTLD